MNYLNFKLQILIIHACYGRALASNEKNSAFCMNWEIKRNWESGRYCEPLTGFTGGPGDRTLGMFTIFSLKLVWYSLLETKKLKLFNKKLLL